MIGGTRQAFLGKTMDSPRLPEIEGRQRARVLSEILCDEWQSGVELILIFTAIQKQPS